MLTETISHVALKRISEKNYTALKGISFSLSEQGTLVIDAPNLLDEPITTNDLVELEFNTSFRWLGRIDNIINSGGHKIIPEKVEGEIGKKIKDAFFVFGLPDAKYGEKLVLFIEGVKNSISLSELKELELRTFEIPKEIHFLNTFIRTETGKIQRKSTVNQFKESA